MSHERDIQGDRKHQLKLIPRPKDIEPECIMRLTRGEGRLELFVQVRNGRTEYVGRDNGQVVIVAEVKEAACRALITKPCAAVRHSA